MLKFNFKRFKIKLKYYFEIVQNNRLSKVNSEIYSVRTQFLRDVFGTGRFFKLFLSGYKQ